MSGFVLYSLTDVIFESFIFWIIICQLVESPLVFFLAPTCLRSTSRGFTLRIPPLFLSSPLSTLPLTQSFLSLFLSSPTTLLSLPLPSGSIILGDPTPLSVPYSRRAASVRSAFELTRSQIDVGHQFGFHHSASLQWRRRRAGSPLPQVHLPVAMDDRFCRAFSRLTATDASGRVRSASATEPARPR